MNVLQTKLTLKYFPPRKSILVRGPHGIGKSEVICQCASELSKETGEIYQVVDIRLSQREAGDILGLPRAVDSYDVRRVAFKDGKKVKAMETVKNVMIHDLPNWFPRDPKSKGFLFMDELDRAQREVQQCSFEMVLDYRLNMHDLPIDWRVIAAINGNSDVYNVLQMDPALLDRFFVIDFKPTVPEWLSWAQRRELPSQVYKRIDDAKWLEEAGSRTIHDAIVKYISKVPNDLELSESAKPEPGKVSPSRRSWVMFSEAVQYMTACGFKVLEDHNYLTLLARGYVGSAVSATFVDYVKKDYKLFSAKEILDNFDKDMSKTFEAMEPNEVAFYSTQIVEYIVNNKVKLSKKQQENLFKYYKLIPQEQGAAFWRCFVGDENDTKKTKEEKEFQRSETVRWYNSNPEIKEMTQKFYRK